MSFFRKEARLVLENSLGVCFCESVFGALSKGEEPASQNAVGLNLLFSLPPGAPSATFIFCEEITAHEMVSCKVEKWVGKVGSRDRVLRPWGNAPPSTTSPPQATTLDLKSKEEKDAELDKRIEALRRKNEALIRRYQVP